MLRQHPHESAAREVAANHSRGQAYQSKTTQGRLAVVNLILGTRKSAWQHLARETARADREEPLPDAADDLLGGNFPSPERIALAREARLCTGEDPGVKSALDRAAL